MVQETLHCFSGILRISDELKGRGRYNDGAIASWEIKRLHMLLVKRRMEAKLLRFLTTNLQHLGRHINSIDSDGIGQVVQQQTASSTSDIQSRLAASSNNVSVERSVLPIRGITTQQVPCLGNQTPIFVIFCAHPLSFKPYYFLAITRSFQN